MRKPLRDLFSSLQEFRASGFGGSVQATFSEGIDNLSEQAPKVLLDVAWPQMGEGALESEVITVESDRQRLHRLADVSPRGAIIEAWLLIEEAISALERDVPQAVGIRGYTGSVRTLERLVQEGKISRHFLSLIPLIYDLRSLRNQAVHMNDQTITPDEAHQYVDTLQRILFLLRMEASKTD